MADKELRAIDEEFKKLNEESQTLANRAPSALEELGQWMLNQAAIWRIALKMMEFFPRLRDAMEKLQRRHDQLVLDVNALVDREHGLHTEIARLESETAWLRQQHGRVEQAARLGSPMPH